MKMNIEMKNYELDHMLGAIRAIAKDNIRLPVKTSYLLSKNRIAIENALKAYSESFNEIVKMYSKDGESKFSVNKDKDPEIYAAVSNAISELQNEVSAVDITPIPISCFEGYDIPYAYVDALVPCIKDGDE